MDQFSMYIHHYRPEANESNTEKLANLLSPDVYLDAYDEKQRKDFVDVINAYVPLKRNGKTADDLFHTLESENGIQLRPEVKEFIESNYEKITPELIFQEEKALQNEYIEELQLKTGLSKKQITQFKTDNFAGAAPNGDYDQKDKNTFTIYNEVTSALCRHPEIKKLGLERPGSLDKHAEQVITRVIEDIKSGRDQSGIFIPYTESAGDGYHVDYLNLVTVKYVAEKWHEGTLAPVEVKKVTPDDIKKELLEGVNVNYILGDKAINIKRTEEERQREELQREELKEEVPQEQIEMPQINDRTIEFPGKDTLVPDKFLMTNDVKQMSQMRDNMIAAYGEQLPEDDRLLMQQRIDAAEHFQKLKNNIRYNKGLPDRKGVLSQQGNLSYLKNIHQESNQRSAEGCWSVSLGMLLQSRGLNLPQETIRAYRSNDNMNALPDNIPADSVAEYNSDTSGDVTSRADLVTQTLPNTAMRTRDYGFSAEIDVNGNRDTVDEKALSNKICSDIHQAINRHLSPVSLRFNGHYRTVVGVNKDDGTIYYKDSMGTESDKTYSCKASDLVAYIRTQPGQRSGSLSLTWLEDLPGKGKENIPVEEYPGYSYQNGKLVSPDKKSMNYCTSDSHPYIQHGTTLYRFLEDDLPGVVVNETLVLPKELHPQAEYRPIAQMKKPANRNRELKFLDMPNLKGGERYLEAYDKNAPQPKGNEPTILERVQKKLYGALPLAQAYATGAFLTKGGKTVATGREAYNNLNAYDPWSGREYLMNELYVSMNDPAFLTSLKTKHGMTDKEIAFAKNQISSGYAAQIYPLNLIAQDRKKNLEKLQKEIGVGSNGKKEENVTSKSGPVQQPQEKQPLKEEVKLQPQAEQPQEEEIDEDSLSSIRSDLFNALPLAQAYATGGFPSKDGGKTATGAEAYEYLQTNDPRAPGVKQAMINELATSMKNPEFIQVLREDGEMDDEEIALVNTLIAKGQAERVIPMERIENVRNENLKKFHKELIYSPRQNFLKSSIAAAEEKLNKETDPQKQTNIRLFLKTLQKASDAFDRIYQAQAEGKDIQKLLFSGHLVSDDFKTVLQGRQALYLQSLDPDYAGKFKPSQVMDAESAAYAEAIKRRKTNTPWTVNDLMASVPTGEELKQQAAVWQKGREREAREREEHLKRNASPVSVKQKQQPLREEVKSQPQSKVQPQVQSQPVQVQLPKVQVHQQVPPQQPVVQNPRQPQPIQQVWPIQQPQQPMQPPQRPSVQTQQFVRQNAVYQNAPNYSRNPVPGYQGITAAVKKPEYLNIAPFMNNITFMGHQMKQATPPNYTGNTKQYNHMQNVIHKMGDEYQAMPQKNGQVRMKTDAFNQSMKHLTSACTGYQRSQKVIDDVQTDRMKIVTTLLSMAYLAYRGVELDSRLAQKTMLSCKLANAQAAQDGRAGWNRQCHWKDFKNSMSEYLRSPAMKQLTQGKTAQQMQPLFRTNDNKFLQDFKKREMVISQQESLSFTGSSAPVKQGNPPQRPKSTVVKGGNVLI